MDQKWEISIDEYENQIIKRRMPRLFKQFAEIHLQFLIQSGDKDKGSSSSAAAAAADAMQVSYSFRQ